LFTNVQKNFFYCNHFSCEFTTFWYFYASIGVIFGIFSQVVFHPSMDVDGPSIWVSILNLFNYLLHWLLQPSFFLLVNNTPYFPWLFILEHLFFSCLTSCCNNNIHHIHIYSDCLYLNSKLNFYYYHRFLMKHVPHLCKLWAIYHFTSIQTTDVACIWRCLMWFLTLLCYLCGYHYSILLLFACFPHYD